MTHSLTVHAASRLHFGLLSFGNRDSRQFGGVGVMVERPGLVMRFTADEEFQVRGPLAQRVNGFAAHWQAYHRLTSPPACRIEVVSAPREHVGLGVGTQVAMATAAGLSALTGLPPQTPAELAASVGRTGRSSVGTYGFALGGLIAERGRLPGEPLSPLDCHLDLPPAWRFVLICPRDAVGIANEAERQAFADLPGIPAAVTQQLAELARERLIPAAARGAFAEFAESVYDYGYKSGECFAPVQGGPYHGQRLTALVNHLRAHGVQGVGQSSWGPTIFALAENHAAAERIAALGRAQEPQADICISPPASGGARIGPVTAPPCEPGVAR